MSAKSDPRYSAHNYGVPLSVAEKAEMQRRVQVEWDSHAAADFGSTLPSWAGYYFDQLDRGAPVFLFAANTEAIEPKLKDLLPPMTDYSVKQVKHSLAELQALKRQIVEDWVGIRGKGIHVTSTGIDLLGNGVTIGVEGLSEAAKTTLSQRFDSDIPIRVLERARGKSDSCPDSDCRPLKGGIMITGDRGYSCTSGFLVRRTHNNGQLAILTAGHCLWINGGRVNNTINLPWYHVDPDVEDLIGASKYDTFAQDSNADVGLIGLQPEDVPTGSRNRLYINPTVGGSGSTYAVTAYVSNGNQTVGSQACAYGFKSDNSECASIVDIDETMDSCVTPVNEDEFCRRIDHVNVYDWNLIGGDSGGPIYQVATSTSRYALGTHVHSEDDFFPQDDHGGPGLGWYTPYEWGRSTYQTWPDASGNSNGDIYNLCVTSSC